MIIISKGFFMSGALERSGISANTVGGSMWFARTDEDFSSLARKGNFELAPHLFSSQGDVA